MCAGTCVCVLAHVYVCWHMCMYAGTCVCMLTNACAYIVYIY